MVVLLKTVRGLLIVVALLLAIVPSAVLVNLLTGGTGYGLCEVGLAGCDTAYLAGPALAGRVLLGLFLVIVGVRVISRIIDRVDKRRRWASMAAYYATLHEEPDRIS